MKLILIYVDDIIILNLWKDFNRRSLFINTLQS